MLFQWNGHLCAGSMVVVSTAEQESWAVGYLSIAGKDSYYLGPIVASMGNRMVGTCLGSLAVWMGYLRCCSWSMDFSSSGWQTQCCMEMLYGLVGFSFSGCGVS